MAFLSSVAAKQEQIMATMGPQNQLAGLAQYRNTLAKMVELAGFKDASQFFTDPAQVPPPPPPPAPTDPTQILAQVEADKIRASIATDAAKLELERVKAQAMDDRERDRIEADVMLRAREIELKYQSTVDTAQIQALMARDREMIKAEQTHATAMGQAELQQQAMQEQAMQQAMQEQAMQEQAMQQQAMQPPTDMQGPAQ
jgi:hypothetical protein